MQSKINAQSCETCVYCQLSPPPTSFLFSHPEYYEEWKLGFCHVNAPDHDGFPAIMVGDWCGQYEEGEDD